MTYWLTFWYQLKSENSHKYFDAVFIKGKHLWTSSKQFIFMLLEDFSIDKFKKDI